MSEPPFVMVPGTGSAEPSFYKEGRKYRMSDIKDDIYTSQRIRYRNNTSPENTSGLSLVEWLPSHFKIGANVIEAAKVADSGELTDMLSGWKPTGKATKTISQKAAVLLEFGPEGLENYSVVWVGEPFKVRLDFVKFRGSVLHSEQELAAMEVLFRPDQFQFKPASVVSIWEPLSHYFDNQVLVSHDSLRKLPLDELMVRAKVSKNPMGEFRMGIQWLLEPEKVGNWCKMESSFAKTGLLADMPLAMHGVGDLVRQCFEMELMPRLLVRGELPVSRVNIRLGVHYVVAAASGGAVASDSHSLAAWAHSENPSLVFPELVFQAVPFEAPKQEERCEVAGRKRSLAAQSSKPADVDSAVGTTAKDEGANCEETVHMPLGKRLRASEDDEGCPPATNAGWASQSKGPNGIEGSGGTGSHRVAGEPIRHSWQEEVCRNMQAKPMPTFGKVGEGIKEKPQGSRMLEVAKVLQPVAMMRKVEAMVDDNLTKLCPARFWASPVVGEATAALMPRRAVGINMLDFVVATGIEMEPNLWMKIADREDASYTLKEIRRKTPGLEEFWANPGGYSRVTVALKTLLRFVSARRILHPLDGSPQALLSVLFQAFGDGKLILGSVDVGFGIFLRDSAGRAKKKQPPATFAQIEEMVAGVLISPQWDKHRLLARLNYTINPTDTVFGKEFNEDSPTEQSEEPRMTRSGDRFPKDGEKEA